jgi:hypothetical protein
MPPGCSPSRNALLFGLEPFNSGHYAFYGEAVFTDEFREHDKPFVLAVGLRLFGGEPFTVNRTVFCCLACDLEIPPVDRMHCFAVN